MDRAALRARLRTLDAERQELRTRYIALLADLERQAASNPHLDPDGWTQDELRGVAAVLGTDVAELRAVGRRSDSDPAAWWWRDVEEGTHMDLRRWLARCWREGLTELRLARFPRGIRPNEGDMQIQAHGNGRAVERVISARERAWLLANWPAEIRGRGWTGRLR